VSGWEVREGDCRELMRELPRSSVQTIITSPPYADQRNYEGGSEARSTERANRNGVRPGVKNQSRKTRSEFPMRFAREFVETYLPPMFDVLTEDGALMLNLGVVVRDGEESAYADHILAGARELGFRLLQRMVWTKPNGNTPSFPGYLRQSHEWVFWLARSIDAYRGYDRWTRTPHKPSTLSRARRPRSHEGGKRDYNLHPDGARPSSVFDCPVGGEAGIRHSAVMPLRLGRHLVALAAPEGTVVLDPFAGSGTTGVAALQLGRGFLGMELQGAHLPECRERLAGAARSPLVPEEQLALTDGAH
jgi:DNA modification methylase